MAETIILKTQAGRSRIIIGRKIIKTLAEYLSKLKLDRKALIITNSTIYKLYGRIIKMIVPSGTKYKTLILPDKEVIKSISYYTKIINTAAKFGKASNIYFISLGGGVISDLTGFSASTFKRGVAYINIPTSLLAQVDAAIGGKTAIDTSFAKNIIGAFWQPRLVLIDTDLLKTLPSAQIQHGFSEILKYGLIKSPKIFNYLQSRRLSELVNSSQIMEEIVSRCVKIKKDIVEQDPKEEKGIRTILNFGHTIGHAIEGASEYKIPHGKAVIWGILAALEISLQAQVLSLKDFLRIKRKTHKALENIGFAFNKEELPKQNKILRFMFFDKKFQDSIRMVLIEKIGKVKVVKNIPLQTVKKVLKNILT